MVASSAVRPKKGWRRGRLLGVEVEGGLLPVFEGLV
jgi:hypothetical protein